MNHRARLLAAVAAAIFCGEAVAFAGMLIDWFGRQLGVAPWPVIGFLLRQAPTVGAVVAVLIAVTTYRWGLFGVAGGATAVWCYAAGTATILCDGPMCLHHGPGFDVDVWMWSFGGLAPMTGCACAALWWVAVEARRQARGADPLQRVEAARPVGPSCHQHRGDRIQP